ncbi:hypothetical protein [Paenibacillus campi]|uniref:hypothetical protein n=1 Tax=Paenibacillus campi TaxID=3106031 RepID=UPI002AFF1513|nr:MULTISPECIES: hypothetical protein [unclassified Paenibacillus]
MKKLWLTLTMTAVFAGASSLSAVPTFAAASDDTPNGTYTMNLNDDTNTDGDVEDDTYSDDNGSDQIDPALLKEADQFDEYLWQLADVLQYEDTAWAAYHTNDHVSAINRKQEYQLMTYTVIPNYTKFLSKLKQIKPENAEVAKIHTQYVKSASANLEGFMLYKKYVSSAKRNDQLLKQVQAKMDKGSALLDQYYSDIDEYSVRFDALYTGEEGAEDEPAGDDTEQSSLDDFI